MLYLFVPYVTVMGVVSYRDDKALYRYRTILSGDGVVLKRTNPPQLTA